MSMPFPDRDQYWIQARTFLERHTKHLDSILAPNEFLEFFPGVYSYNVSYLFVADRFNFVVFHKGMTAEIERKLALEILECFHLVFANEVFVIYAKKPIFKLFPPRKAHLRPLLKQLEENTATSDRKPSCAAVITTYNRPNYLARSLDRVLALDIPVVVVDDGSLPQHQLENRRIVEKHRVPLIQIPENRGLPNAINVGIGYWLADPDIEWISYFQDDVDIKPNILEVLAKIQNPQDRPLLTGRDDPKHQTFKSTTINGYRVLLKRSISGRHFHAHRDYWQAVLPIPTPYLGAPKADKGKPGQGSDGDWWIASWSPESIVKKGGYLICVPDLVSTFDRDGKLSTWDNPD